MIPFAVHQCPSPTKGSDMTIYKNTFFDSIYTLEAGKYFIIYTITAPRQGVT